MKNRDRAFSAIIHDGKIVMVRVVDMDRQYWTLPGGGVEQGESNEEAARREAKEEVNLDIRIIRTLFDREYSAGIEYCFLAEIVEQHELILGYDPELDVDEQVLAEAHWITIESVLEDIHVSRVLESLTQEELNKYNIKK
ncbi:ADP-ribose pyrophosphatase YjhB, NUDIX family [Paenibacillaceae bacterium GAS479]|nr:ADP-ribose pyrophosphatase YjhB, NUDIX family [Paenibacillaceae bacterium GAS479]